MMGRTSEAVQRHQISANLTEGVSISDLPLISSPGSLRPASPIMNTNPVLQELCRMFWISFIGSAVCAAISYILIWRRALWLRYLDAEEAFWLRFGFPKGGFTRRFCEGRLITISFVIFTGIFLALAVVSAVSALGYIHFLHRPHRV